VSCLDWGDQQSATQAWLFEINFWSGFTMNVFLKLGLGSLALSGVVLSAHADEMETKTCMIVGMEEPVEADATCPGTVADILNSIVIEKERVKLDADGNAMVDADGAIIMEPYTETYKLMASYAAKAGLGDAISGGEVPQLHGGMLEDGTITVFAIKDSVLSEMVSEAIKAAEAKAETSLSDEDTNRILYMTVGSQIATRPYTKTDMWNGQMKYRNLAGGLIMTNFLTASGDEANGRKFQQMDVLASNGVVHLMN
jgi:hypothetical protein